MKNISAIKLLIYTSIAVIVFSCIKKISPAKTAIILHENTATIAQRAAESRAKTPAKLADGLVMSLWASDSLAPDPVAMSIDDKGSVYLTRTNRMKNSEFDIRGYRHWMTESIGLNTVEDRRAFLRKTFAPEKSAENSWVKDLNEDGSHDWKDLAVEKDEIWRLDDTSGKGFADVATRIFTDFSEEVTDVAGGLLVKGKEIFWTLAPDLWKLTDTNNDGFPDKSKSISHGYAVHIGFSGHNMSGVVEGPDGRLYWNMGDIGGNVTALNGENFPNPQSGFIARSNPDGSDFEIFATGLRNTHEFVFDEYGNLISSDNDGDHAGESERLVHIVEGSDAGWRNNWQYGKYTDPKNNRYNVWMDEKLSKPHWDGQAAYIIPPIQNFHNGPTGMVYNPGTALGSVWKNKYFLVEFVGGASRSHIWSFGLKPKGASFVLDGETDLVSGILPTGIRFGPDGALYVADWITGWDAKNYGKVWKIDVTPETNDLAAIREETKRLIQLDYTKQSDEMLESLLANVDMRIRQKAQFELVDRGNKGFAIFQKVIANSPNQLARVNAVWGVGQLTRKDAKFAIQLTTLLIDKDPEIITQAIKLLGDAKVLSAASSLIPFLKNDSPRIKFYAAEALGRMKEKLAVEPLLAMIKANNDEEIYLRHAGVMALSRIGIVEPIIALVGNESKALRTAAVLVLRKMNNENIAVFLNDKDEYIVAEAARAINDDLSIIGALPNLANVLNEKRFSSEPIIRRAINAALRVGTEKTLNDLIAFSTRTDISDAMKNEALATLGSWANPSQTDRVDGRYRGIVTRDAAIVKAKIQPFIGGFLTDKNDETVISAVSLLSNLHINTSNTQLTDIYAKTANNKLKSAVLSALNQLNYPQMDALIKTAMDDKNENIRATALSLLNDSNTSVETLPLIVSNIIEKGSTKEKQQILTVLGTINLAKSEKILDGLIDQYNDKKIPNNLSLELQEAIDGSKSERLKTKYAALKKNTTVFDEYLESLNGGNWMTGRNTFNYNSTAQCVRCHTVGKDGGNVGPALTHIASTLTREQILEALVDPSKRLSPGFGTVTVLIKGGQEVTGVLAKETDTDLTINTSDAEPLVIEKSRIQKRENNPSSMPAMGSMLSKREIRDVVEYLTTLR
jgi:quinoprotein glucose dehydrogenase